MRKLFKNLTAIGLSVTMVVGTASMASAAVAKGTDVSNGKAWTSYSIHTREDNGSWEDKLIGAGQKYQNKENTYKSYGEDAKITTQTSSSFTMNVVSTGWKARILHSHFRQHTFQGHLFFRSYQYRELCKPPF